MMTDEQRAIVSQMNSPRVSASFDEDAAMASMAKQLRGTVVNTGGGMMVIQHSVTATDCFLTTISDSTWITTYERLDDDGQREWVEAPHGLDATPFEVLSTTVAAIDLPLI